MSKKIILALVLLLTVVLGFSCTLDNLTSFMDQMGSNALGNLVYDVDVKPHGQSIDDIKNDEGSKLGEVLDSLISNMEEGSKVTSIVAPLDESVKEQLVQNLSSDAGKKKLEALKETKADFGATEEEKKANIEAVKGTAMIVDSYLQNLPPEGTGNADVDKLLDSMKTSFGNLATNPEKASKGDVLGLQYTVDLLDTVANSIKEPFQIGMKDEDGNPILNEQGQQKNKKITSTTILNTILQNNSNPEEVLNQYEFQDFLKDKKNSKIIADIASSAQDFVNVVGVATNFTGGVELGGLIGSFFGNANQQPSENV